VNVKGGKVAKGSILPRQEYDHPDYSQQKLEGADVAHDCIKRIGLFDTDLHSIGNIKDDEQLKYIIHNAYYGHEHTHGYDT